MAIKIRRNVPIKPPRPSTGRPPKYPWADMRVGDSFYVPGMTPSQMSSAWRRARAKLGHKYSARTERDGVRVWRIK